MGDFVGLDLDLTRNFVETLSLSLPSFVYE